MLASVFFLYSVFIYSFFIQKDSPANIIVQKSAQCQLSDAPALSADIVF